MPPISRPRPAEHPPLFWQIGIRRRSVNRDFRRRARRLGDAGAVAWRGSADYMRHEVKIGQRKTGVAVVAMHYLYDSYGRLTDVWQAEVKQMTSSGQTVRTGVTGMTAPRRRRSAR